MISALDVLANVDSIMMERYGELSRSRQVRVLAEVLVARINDELMVIKPNSKKEPPAFFCRVKGCSVPVSHVHKDTHLKPIPN
jgi:hypothetical protein